MTTLTEATEEQKRDLAKARAQYAELPMVEGWTGIADAVVQFTDVDDYTTFVAKFAVKDDDIIVHFYMPSELEKAPAAEQDLYWLKMFPVAVEAVAPEHFEATYPRLTVKYTEELKSWFLRARNYGHLLAPDRYVRKFLDRMDAGLDAAVSAHRAQI